MDALHMVTTWPVENVSAAILHDGTVAQTGDAARVYQLASLTKPITAWAIMIGVEEGIVDLDAPEPDADGASMRHLLAHAAGYPFDGPDKVAPAGKRRIYSNTGIEVAAKILSDAAEMPFGDYLTEAVLAPLGMGATQLSGSPAHGARSTLGDMILFVGELLQPTLIATSTYDDMIRSQFPNLAGIVPGVGKFDPCSWGLGVEVRGNKTPHWTGPSNSPATFGHFGGAGTMMWVDPSVGVGVVALTDRDFDAWSSDALQLWPEFSNAVLAEVGSPS